MQSHEAIQKAVNGKTMEHAKRLGVSLSLVSKWQEPSLDFTDSGAYNPLDRIETIIETSLALGNPPERAFAPAYYLAERFGLIIFPAPGPEKGLPEIHKELSRVTVEAVDEEEAEELAGELNKYTVTVSVSGSTEITKEFGDMLSASGACLVDGDISRREAAKIKAEAHELQRALAAFIAKVEEASGE